MRHIPQWVSVRDAFRRDLGKKKWPRFGERARAGAWDFQNQDTGELYQQLQVSLFCLSYEQTNYFWNTFSNK